MSRNPTSVVTARLLTRKGREAGDGPYDWVEAELPYYLDGDTRTWSTPYSHKHVELDEVRHTHDAGAHAHNHLASGPPMQKCPWCGYPAASAAVPRPYRRDVGAPCNHEIHPHNQTKDEPMPETEPCPYGHDACEPLPDGSGCRAADPLYETIVTVPKRLGAFLKVLAEQTNVQRVRTPVGAPCDVIVRLHAADEYALAMAVKDLEDRLEDMSGESVDPIPRPARVTKAHTERVEDEVVRLRGALVDALELLDVKSPTVNSRLQAVDTIRKALAQ